jgi:hypothetical protein
MVSALFTAFALIAAGQVEIPESRSSVSNVRSERARTAVAPVRRIRHELDKERSRKG